MQSCAASGDVSAEALLVRRSLGVGGAKVEAMLDNGGGSRVLYDVCFSFYPPEEPDHFSVVDKFIFYHLSHGH